MIKIVIIKESKWKNLINIEKNDDKKESYVINESKWKNLINIKKNDDDKENVIINESKWKNLINIDKSSMKKTSSENMHMFGCRQKWWHREFWLCLWLLMILMTTAVAQTSTQTSTQTSMTGCQPYLNITPTNCSGMHLRWSPKSLNKLCSCSRVNGKLVIFFMSEGDENLRILQSFSFPHLREITKYLVVYDVRGITSLGNLFPHLTVIRGESLFYNYALVLGHLPNLTEVGLTSLTSILRGSVRIQKNKNLCYVNTVDWDNITQFPLSSNYFSGNKAVSECGTCSASCLSNDGCGRARCWRPNTCQTICGREVGCMKGDLCHKDCINGCSSANKSSCMVCTHDKRNQLCMNEESMDVTKSSDNKTFTSQNQDICSDCQPCKDTHAIINSIADAENIKHCTSLRSLEVTYIGLENGERELAKLLSNVVEIHDYIKISRTNLTSVSILSNLKKIYGKNLFRDRYSLVVLDNPILHNLDPWLSIPDLIHNGRVSFHSNPRLCLHLINKLGAQSNMDNFNETDVSKSNGKQTFCERNEMRVSVSASPRYGTLLLRFDCIAFHPINSTFHINYRQSSTNITFRETSCSATRRWSVVEVRPDPPDDCTNLSSIHPTSCCTNLTLRLSGLSPNTRYALYLKVLNGYSVHLSSLVYGITNPFNPSQPVEIKWRSVNKNSLQLRWKPPLYPNGDIDHYFVTAHILHNIYHNVTNIDLCTTDGQNNIRELESSMNEKMDKYWYWEDDDKKLTKDETCNKPSTFPNCCFCSQSPQHSATLSSTNFENNILHDVDSLRYAKTLQSQHYNIEGHYKKHPTPSASSADYQKPSTSMASYDGENWTEVITNKSNITLNQLRPYTTYIVNIIACLAPTDCNSHSHGLLEWTSTDKKAKCKLCSLIPAVISATTAPDNSSDMVQENSLKVITSNVSSSFSTTFILQWLPPANPNGPIISYYIECNHQGRSWKQCVSQEYFDLKNLSPGEHKCRVQVLTLAGLGKFSNEISFYVKDVGGDGMNVLWIGVAVVGVMAIGGVAGWRCWQRWRRKHEIPQYIHNYDVNPFYREGFAPSEMFHEEYILWRDELRVLKDVSLGSGNFGTVFAGELQERSSVRRVAVKTHADNASRDQIIQFLREAALMQGIISHHIVRLVGVVGDYAPVYVVMEFMQEGDLRIFLIKNRNSITDQKVMTMAVEAADGMSYLEWQRLVHRDLAARNCLLDHHLTLKIGDFGLSRTLQSDYYRMSSCGDVPVRWMAPESLECGLFTSKSDVWSYGVLLWEMVTRADVPYKNNTNLEVENLVVKQRATLRIPRHCPPQLARIMHHTWCYNPDQRPTFLYITDTLLKYVSPTFRERFKRVSFLHNLEASGRTTLEERTMLPPSNDVHDTLLHHQLSNNTTPIHNRMREEESAGTLPSCDHRFPSSSGRWSSPMHSCSSLCTPHCQIRPVFSHLQQKKHILKHPCTSFGISLFRSRFCDNDRRKLCNDMKQDVSSSSCEEPHIYANHNVNAPPRLCPQNEHELMSPSGKEDIPMNTTSSSVRHNDKYLTFPIAQQSQSLVYPTSLCNSFSYDFSKFSSHSRESESSTSSKTNSNSTPSDTSTLSVSVTEHTANHPRPNSLTLPLDASRIHTLPTTQTAWLNIQDTPPNYYRNTISMPSFPVMFSTSNTSLISSTSIYPSYTSSSTSSLSSVSDSSIPIRQVTSSASMLSNTSAVYTSMTSATPIQNITLNDVNFTTSTKHILSSNTATSFPSNTSYILHLVNTTNASMKNSSQTSSLSTTESYEHRPNNKKNSRWCSLDYLKEKNDSYINLSTSTPVLNNSPPTSVESFCTTSSSVMLPPLQVALRHEEICSNDNAYSLSSSTSHMTGETTTAGVRHIYKTVTTNIPTPTHMVTSSQTQTLTTNHTKVTQKSTTTAFTTSYNHITHTKPETTSTTNITNHSSVSKQSSNIMPTTTHTIANTPIMSYPLLTNITSNTNQGSSHQLTSVFVPSPTSTSTRMSTSPSSSRKTQFEVFSATSDLGNGRRSRSRRRHGPKKAVADEDRL